MSDEIKIFISYGRRDAARFVDRLENDLRQSGFTVFRDTTDLRAPKPWDEQLEAAIKQSNAVIAILSPHAVRTGPGGDSVCLDELHVARFSLPPTPIVPIMLIPCSPPWIICRLQWLDFNKADTDDSRYRNALAQLLRTIQLVRDGGTLSNRSIDLEPLDFDLYLKAKTRDFIGREWLVSEVLERVCAPDSPRVILMTGEAGWGKSAFAAHLFYTDPTGRLLAAHFCRNDRPDTVDPHRFVENIAALTALRIEAYNERLKALVGAYPELLASQSAAEKFERLFLEPLDAASRAAPLEPLQRYFLVDGLDEKLSKEEGTIHQLLAQSEHLFPSWLKLIATSRETSIITGAFSDPVILKFERHDKRNLSDITQIVTNIIEGRAPGHTVVLARNGATSAKRRCNGQTWLWWHNDKRLTTTSRFAGRSISGFRRVHFQSLPKLPPLVPAAALFAFDQRCNSSSSSSSRPTSSVRPAAIAAPCQEAPRL